MSGGFDRRNLRLNLERLERECLALAEKYRIKGLGQQENDLRWVAILLEKVRSTPLPSEATHLPPEH